MYSSHCYPYQLGNQQQPQQPQQPPQYTQYTPQPPTQPRYPHPPSYQPGCPQSQPQPQPQPSYPNPQEPRRPPQPAPRPQQLPARFPPPYSPPESRTVSMPQLQRPEPDPPNSSQQIGDPRFVLLLSMGTEELNGLLEDEDKFNEVFTNMEELKQKKLEKEMSMAENQSLADFNLSREPRLSEGRAQLISRLHEAQRISDSYTVGKGKLDVLREQTSLDTALALMQAASADAEDESEEVADDFLKGDLTLEDFLDTFMPKRQTAHLRHIKSEKMQALLTQQRQTQSRGAVTPNSATPPYPSPQQQPQPHYQQSAAGSQPYGYQPQRPAPRPPFPGPRYGPGAAAPRMPTLGSYPQ